MYTFYIMYTYIHTIICENATDYTWAGNHPSLRCMSQYRRKDLSFIYITSWLLWVHATRSKLLIVIQRCTDMRPANASRTTVGLPRFHIQSETVDLMSAVKLIQQASSVWQCWHMPECSEVLQFPSEWYTANKHLFLLLNSIILSASSYVLVIHQPCWRPEQNLNSTLPQSKNKVIRAESHKHFYFENVYPGDRCVSLRVTDWYWCYNYNMRCRYMRDENTTCLDLGSLARFPSNCSRPVFRQTLLLFPCLHLIFYFS